MQSTYGDQITIEVVSGGFILAYPTLTTEEDKFSVTREVFSSQRKLNQRLKEVIGTLSLVSE
jgi:hypothetical protein